MKKSIPFLLVLLLMPFGWAFDSELETEAKAIEGLLISPCCWRQPVSVHFSPASDEVREEVREMLSAGLTREEILEKYVAEYGDRILSKPPARGFNLLAYFLPVIFLGLGAAVAVIVIRRLRPEKPAIEKAAPASALEGKYAKRLEKELWGE